jgi:ABC-type sulfate/molybdate transport systems ATPase subunit
MDGSSRADVDGAIAFVDQQPWILNMSLRENVLISGPSDPVEEGRYQEALRVTGLLEDLDALPAGDKTEIGERGINISGGQKQRVCLARLVYSEASICLLDDPTSALDSLMTAHVLEQCMHGTLERQKRTRVVVTNVVEPLVLRRADRVVWMDDGRIRACGSFDELAEQGGRDDGSSFSVCVDLSRHSTRQSVEITPNFSSYNRQLTVPLVCQALLAARPKQTQNEEERPSSEQSATQKSPDGDSARTNSSASTQKLISAEDRETGTVAKAVVSARKS